MNARAIGKIGGALMSVIAKILDGVPEIPMIVKFVGFTVLLPGESREVFTRHRDVFEVNGMRRDQRRR